MKTVIGIDVGISTTKIVGIRDSRIVAPFRVKASDAVTSLYGALGKYLDDNNLTLSDIERVMLTGVGATYIKGDVYGLPTVRIEEFVADGRGASHLSGLSDMIVVSMGTGTTLVRYDNGTCGHLGGLGMGGGTLTGLSRLLLGTDDVRHVSEIAQRGDIRAIDLQIGDICADDIPGLPSYATASLFGNAQTTATHEDIALGIICTVVQTIGSAAVLAAEGSGVKDIVMIGNLTLLPQCKQVFDMMEQLYGVHFVIPEYSEYATAIGAALG